MPNLHPNGHMEGCESSLTHHFRNLRYDETLFCMFVAQLHNPRGYTLQITTSLSDVKRLDAPLRSGGSTEVSEGTQTSGRWYQSWSPWCLTHDRELSAELQNHGQAVRMRWWFPSNNLLTFCVRTLGQMCLTNNKWDPWWNRQTTRLCLVTYF